MLLVESENILLTQKMMSNFVYNQLDEFTNELKKLSKKYPSLKQDIEDYKDTIETFPKWFGNNIVPISDLWKDIKTPIYKIRKFPCEYLKDNKSIRIIYAYHEDINTIDLIKIDFVEIYHKNTKDNHNIERIIKYYWKNVNQ